MPDNASIPDQACSTACSTSLSQLCPACTTTATPPQESSALTVNPSEAILMTVPGNPSSDTRRLDPPLTISTCSAAASAERTASMMSASVRASMYLPAGPPTAEVVREERSVEVTCPRYLKILCRRSDAQYLQASFRATGERAKLTASITITASSECRMPTCSASSPSSGGPHRN